MFCTKCGKQVPDGSVICPYCGSPLAAPQAAPQQAAPQAAPQAVANYASNIVNGAKKGDKKSLIIAIAAAVAVLVVVIGLISLLAGKSPKKIVKTLLKKQESLQKDATNFEEKYCLYANKKALKKLDIDVDDDDDEDGKITWKVTKQKKFGKDDEVTEGVKAYVKGGKGSFKNKKGDDDKIKGAALVEVSYTYKPKKGEKQKYKVYYCLAKVGGKWYLVDDDAEMAETITEAGEYWEKFAEKKSSKKNDDDDDD